MAQSSNNLTLSSDISNTALGDAYQRAIDADDKARAAPPAKAEKPAAKAKAKPATTKAKGPAKAKPAKVAVTKVAEGVTGREARFAANAARDIAPQRAPLTIASLQAICPTPKTIANIVRVFAKDDVDGVALHDDAMANMIALDVLLPPMNERAKEIHQGRIVGAFILSAYKACEFFAAKQRAAIDMQSKMHNEHRDEDRAGVAGFETNIERARDFAADLAIQAYTLTVLAMAAADAYEHITGSVYRPYTSNAPTSTRGVTAAASQARADALAG